MKSKKSRSWLIRLGVLIVSVAAIWAAAVGTAYARRYDENKYETIVSGRADGLEISYYDNTIGMNVNLGSMNQLNGYSDQGDGKAAAGGMFMNVNAQMMLAMANMSGQGDKVKNLLQNVLGIQDASVCYATSLEIEVMQPCRVITFKNTTGSPAELNFDYNLLVLNDADVQIGDASSASVTKDADLPLNTLLQQFEVPGKGMTAYEMGLTAGVLMNNDNYAMTQKTMTGHVQTLVQPGDSYNLTIEFPARDFSSVQVQITNAYLTEMTAKTVTFLPAEFDYSVGGVPVSKNGSAQAVEIDCVNGTDVTFDAAGKKLGYWLDGDGKIYKSDDAVGSAKLYYGRDTMKPAFVSESNVRRLEASGITFYGWSDAIDAAGAYGIVTLIDGGEINISALSENVKSNAYNSGTSFTVPANVLFVVPHTPEELAPGYWYYSSHSTDVTTDGQSDPSEPYCKLYVPAGYALNVAAGGNLLVNANMTARSDTQGEIATGFGMIELDGEMTVNGTLTARGYIAQKEYASRTSDNKEGHLGHISVNAGGEVNIVFQMMDFRGGSATFATFDQCMPITMYSFDNVMVKADYENGSTLSAYCVVGVSGMAARTMVPILSATKGSMFSMGSGSVVSTDYQYDGDRFIVNAEAGELSLNYININLYGSGDSAVGLTTASYQLPLHDGMVVNVKDGATVTLDYALKLLPGAEINVDNGATVNLNNRLFLFGLEDYNPAFSYNSNHFRKRTDCVLVEGGGTAVTPTGDPILNTSGRFVIGASSANEYSTGKIFQSVNMKTGIHAGDGAEFIVPQGYDLTTDTDSAPYTVELEGTHDSATTTYMDPVTNLSIWEPVKGLFGGMSNRIEDDEGTVVDERYISFINQDLAPADEGYTFGAGEQDGEYYWYRYRIEFKDTDGNTFDTHLVAPAYDELMIEDLTFGGSGHVVTSIDIKDDKDYQIPANDDYGTGMTYEGYVGADYENAEATATDFSEYNAWQGVKFDNLNLATDESGDPVTDFVVTVGLQKSGWLVNWEQTASGSSETTTWHSFTDPDGKADYGKNGEFSILSYEITRGGVPVEGAVLSARLEGDVTHLMLDGIEFSGETDAVTVNMITASEFVNATLHYPDNHTSTERMPVVGGTNALIVSIPQPDEGWYIADSVTAEGYTVINNKDSVTLTWEGEAPSNSQVDVYLASYAYKLVYDITNESADATLAFDPVYTNEASFTQNSENVIITNAEGTHKYYFVGDPDSLTLTTETVVGTDLYTVEATMKAYDWQVQYYNEDVLLNNEFLMNDEDASAYEFDEHTAFDGEISRVYPGGGSDGLAVDNSNNAYLDSEGNLVRAKLQVKNVKCNVNLTVTTTAFDHIVSFFNDSDHELSRQYVADGGSAAYSTVVGYYITACSEPTAVNNDGLENLTNTIADGWGSVRIDNVTENKAVTITESPYVTKIQWVQKDGDNVVSSTVRYFAENASSDSMTPVDGYVFGNEFTVATSRGGEYSNVFELGKFDLTIKSQGDFEITLPLNEYAHRVKFVNSDTSEVVKTVYADASGNDLSSQANPIPYFQYSGSAKIMLKDVEVTSGTATITEPDTKSFDGVEQQIWRKVEVTNFGTKEVVVAFAPAPYKHILTVNYTDPWGTTNESVYMTVDTFTKTVENMEIIEAESSDATVSDVSAASFTVTAPEGIDPTVEVTCRITGVENLTSANITKVGAKNPATFEIIDSTYGIFEVTCDKACTIVIDNGDDTYEKIASAPVEGKANTYSFQLTREQALKENLAIRIAIKGDVDLNGQLNGNDAIRINRYVAGMTTNNAKISALGLVLADVDGNKKINGNDAIRINRFVAGMMTNNAKIYW